MVDFHSHILPEMDDGAKNVKMSIAMLKMSRMQGISTIFATSHFYAYDEYPEDFIERRNRSVELLLDEMSKNEYDYPRIIPGAEVYYFPGMSDAESLSMLKMGNSNCLLVEPPMDDWSDEMLDEIERTGINQHCIPVITHIDRYISYFDDESYFDRLRGRKLLVQANAGFFLNDDTFSYAMSKLKSGKICFLGSDCHDTSNRPPNIGKAVKKIIDAGGTEDLKRFNGRIDYFLSLSEK